MVLVLDLWLDFRGAPVWAKVKIDKPAAELVIQVTGRQFAWEVLYPGPTASAIMSDDTAQGRWRRRPWERDLRRSPRERPGGARRRRP